jgi:hypothetical protein
MNKLLVPLVLLILVGCKDPYDIPLKNTDKSLLVVDGILVTGSDSTIITLSKTVNVNDTAKIKPVLNANLVVEEQNGGTWALHEMSGGRYGSDPLGLVPGKSYRLRIKTSDNKEYLSDYVVPKITPPIDSISWKKENGDMIIHVNTHDPANATKYYRWDYDETWEILSYYYSNYQWVSGTTIVANPGYHYQCWKYNHSTTINIGTSALLSSDVISELPLFQIPAGSEKIGVRYSVIVRQQSLTKEAYEYLKLMKKSTESLGSIFDPLPSELKGNIYSVSNPGEGVIGYLTASGISQKRIFITKADADWKFVQDCNEVKRVANNPDSIRFYIPIYLPWSDEMRGAFYLVSTPSCVDCTFRGGALGKPSYW